MSSCWFFFFFFNIYILIENLGCLGTNLKQITILNDTLMKANVEQIGVETDDLAKVRVVKQKMETLGIKCGDFDGTINCFVPRFLLFYTTLLIRYCIFCWHTVCSFNVYNFWIIHIQSLQLWYIINLFNVFESSVLL